MSSELIANVSHEIRTPLHGIINIGNELKEKLSDKALKKMIQTIVGTAHYLLGVANDVIDISRLKADDVDTVKKEYNMRKTIEDVVDMVAVVAKQKKVEIAYIIDPELPLR